MSKSQKKKITLHDKIEEMLDLARQNRYRIDARFRHTQRNRGIVRKLDKIKEKLSSNQADMPKPLSPAATAAIELSEVIKKLLVYKPIQRSGFVHETSSVATKLVIPDAEKTGKALKADIAELKKVRADYIKNLHLMVNKANEIAKMSIDDNSPDKFAITRENVADLLSIIYATIFKAIDRSADLRMEIDALRVQRTRQRIHGQHKRKSTLGQSRSTMNKGGSMSLSRGSRGEASEMSGTKEGSSETSKAGASTPANKRRAYQSIVRDTRRERKRLERIGKKARKIQEELDEAARRRAEAGQERERKRRQEAEVRAGSATAPSGKRDRKPVRGGAGGPPAGDPAGGPASAKGRFDYSEDFNGSEAGANDAGGSPRGEQSHSPAGSGAPDPRGLEAKYSNSFDSMGEGEGGPRATAAAGAEGAGQAAPTVPSMEPTAPSGLGGFSAAGPASIHVAARRGAGGAGEPDTPAQQDRQPEVQAGLDRQLRDLSASIVETVISLRDPARGMGDYSSSFDD